MIDTTHLAGHHRRTAEAILSHPISHNIEWRDVLTLLEAIGEVTEGHNGKFKIVVGGEAETLERPSSKDISEQMVVDLRRMLGAAGITEEGLHERQGVAHEPAATQPSGHAILVIGYHGAHIYPTDAGGNAPRSIVPDDPRGRLRTMHHKAGNPEGWYGRLQASWYAEVAQGLQSAAEVLIIANGKGHSNVLVQFTQYLAKHDHDLLARIAGSIDVEEEDLSEAQIIALAREFYGDSPPRDQGDGRWGEG
jgi:hypothetical protein